MADYLVVQDVKDRIPDLGTQYDAVLAALITQATADINRLTGQFFDPVAATKTFDGSGSRTLILPWAWPLASITTLKVRSGGEGSTQITVPSSDYFLEPAGRPAADPARWIELASRPSSGVSVFTAGKGTAEIAGTWGRAAVSGDIKSVCLEMVIQAFRQRGAAGTNQTVDNLDLDQILRGLTPRSLRILGDHGMGQAVYTSS